MTDVRASFAGASVHQPKTAELIAEQIRKRIALQELPAGSMLPPESVLMGQFGISRPTLREAIRILESEALIVLRRGARGGAEVLGPDPTVASRHLGMLLQLRQTTLRDVYHARTVLEPACAALLAARSTEAIVARLTQALAEESAQGDDLERLTLAGTAFHKTIIELAGDSTIGTLSTTIINIVEFHGDAFSEVERGDPARRQRHLRSMHLAHERLLAAVRAGLASDAELIWREHMEAVSEVLLDRIGMKTVNLFPQ